MGVKAVGSTYISHDKAIVEAFDKDPLVYHGKIGMYFHTQWN